MLSFVDSFTFGITYTTYYLIAFVLRRGAALLATIFVTSQPLFGYQGMLTVVSEAEGVADVITSSEMQPLVSVANHEIMISLIQR